MIGGLLILVLVLALVVLAVRRVRGDDGEAPRDGHAVRRIFQYLLLYGLVVVVAIGFTGLLGRLLEGATLVRSDQTELARNLAFTVVGAPLLVGVALWSRRIMARDTGEARSLGWAVYITCASLTSLVMAATGVEAVLGWAVGLQDYSSRAPAQVLVWGGMWAAHRWIDSRVTPPGHACVHHLAGSLVGLVTAATGLVGLLAGALRVLSGMDVDAMLPAGASPILQGAVTALTGAAVWSVYWLRTAARHDREPLWITYVLLPGVAGGLVSAIVAASALLYSGLVWVLGEPPTRIAAEHFSAAPTQTAAAAVGMLVWWYHQAVLRAAGTEEARTEVTRVYEYLMAGIGLLAAAGGLTMLVAALIESFTGSPFVGGSTANTLLAGTTVLTVGGPLWWLYWRKIRAATRMAAAEEDASPTRRAYLVVLFGVGAVAAVVALVVAVSLLLSDVMHGTDAAETFRRVRYAVGVLLTAPAIAGYHWTVWQDGGRRLRSPTTPPGPAFVLLVGPAGRATAREVAHRTHGQVEAWSRTDDTGPPWTADDVMAALASTPADEVIVLSDTGRLHAVAIRRRPADLHQPRSSHQPSR